MLNRICKYPFLVFKFLSIYFSKKRGLVYKIEVINEHWRQQRNKFASSLIPANNNSSGCIMRNFIKAQIIYGILNFSASKLPYTILEIGSCKFTCFCIHSAKICKAVYNKPTGNGTYFFFTISFTIGMNIL